MLTSTVDRGCRPLVEDTALCRSPRNRLTTVTGPAAKSFTYDAFGNLATRTDVGTLSYFPGSHRLQNVSGTTTVGYSYQN